MADNQQKKYRRLGGSGYYPSIPRMGVVALFFFIGILVLLLYRRRELYLGADHLLTVETTGYTEEYRFFNFADIQSITFRGTAYYVTWIIVLTIACAAFILIGAQIGDIAGWIVFGSLSGILGITLLVHVIKGPTVECKLKTAVSEIELPSLSRLNHARSCLAEIRTQIEQVQGRLESEDIARGLQEGREPTRPIENTAKPVSLPAAEPSGVDADEQDSGASF